MNLYETKQLVKGQKVLVEKHWKHPYLDGVTLTFEEHSKRTNYVKCSYKNLKNGEKTRTYTFRIEDLKLTS